MGIIIRQISAQKNRDDFFDSINFDKLKEKINLYSSLTLMQSTGYHLSTFNYTKSYLSPKIKGRPSLFPIITTLLF